MTEKKLPYNKIISADNRLILLVVRPIVYAPACSAAVYLYIYFITALYLNFYLTNKRTYYYIA